MVASFGVDINMVKLDLFKLKEFFLLQKLYDFHWDIKVIPFGNRNCTVTGQLGIPPCREWRYNNAIEQGGVSVNSYVVCYNSLMNDSADHICKGSFQV